MDGTTTSVIAATSDDFETVGGVGSKDLEFGFQGGNPNTVALRLTGLDLAANAEIESACFVFQAEATNTGATNLTIETRNSTSAANLDARSFLPTTVAWTNVEPCQANQTCQSVDVSDLIEQLVGQNGLDPTDALGFRITGTGLRQAYSFDSNGEKPRLVINFSDDQLF